jgi:hypothetical protein
MLATHGCKLRRYDVEGMSNPDRSPDPLTVPALFAQIGASATAGAGPFSSN